MGRGSVLGSAFVLVLLAAASLGAQPAPSAPRPASRTLDSFERLDGWSAHPSDGVTLNISSDAGARGRGMRLDFDFHGGGGYAIARKKFDIPLPANYAFAFRIRGEARPQNLEFKLIDSTGDNVWWSNQRDFVFPRAWTTVTRKRRHIAFAWGPVGGGELRRVATVEVAITAGQGGKGTIWLDDFTLTPLEPVVAGPLPKPAASASSSIPGHAASLATDGDSGTSWRSARSPVVQALALDLGTQREYGGVVIDWADGDRATDYAIDASADGARWEEVRRVTGGDGSRDMVDLPEGEARRLRIRMLRAAGRSGYAISEVAVMPLAWSATPNDYARSVARVATRGTYPRYVTDSVQVYWTLVGVSGDRHEGLMGDDGALESGRGGYSVEPFLRVDSAFIGWADVESRPSLEDGSLPIPSVEWTPRAREARALTLAVTAFANGTADASTLRARYRLTNHGAEPRRATLYLAIRPFQVNPPWQFLNAPGGVARVRSIRWDGAAVLVDSGRPVVPATPPTAFGAASLDQGEIVESLRRGVLPRRTRVVDERGRASGVLAFEMALAPGATRDVWIELPPAADRRPASTTAGDTALHAALRAWREQLGRVRVELPSTGTPRGTDVAATLRSTLAYILINRNGPAIQPGSRSYSRSWIRDGALTSAALLRLGHPEEVKQFIEWFAPYQYPSGKVPCCVDARGADPVPENDSHGEFIYLVAEYYRYTGDRALLEKMWPHVSAAAAYIDSLRHQRMTPEYRTPAKRAFYGLLPESISHEGYSAKPMHSYWDDFFALKGLKDATDLAAALGRESDRARLAAIRDEFRRDLYASLNAVIATRGIAYVPGSVELADFDATSTTTAIEPGGELERLPQPALRQGFERYYRGVLARRDSAWEGYTPYELRTVGTFVRMGERTRAHAVLAALMADRRPPEWNQWAEVVYRDPKTPRFIGDMPHTWVGSDFVRSALDMFAYDREADSALVVGAGVPATWVTSAPGVVVEGLHTAFGTLDLTMRAQGNRVRATIGGAMRVPPGGIVVRSPLGGPRRGATVDGAPAAVRQAGESVEVVVRRLPAVVEFAY